MTYIADKSDNDDFDSLVHIMHDLDPDDQAFFFRLTPIESFVRYLFFSLAQTLPDRVRIYRTALLIDSLPSSLIKYMKLLIDHQVVCDSFNKLATRCDALSSHHSINVPCSITILKELLIESNLWDTTAHISNKGGAIYLRHNTFGLSLFRTVRELPNFNSSKAYRLSLDLFLSGFSLGIQSIVRYYKEFVNQSPAHCSLILPRSFPPTISCNFSSDLSLTIDSDTHIVLPRALFTIEWDSLDILLRILSLLSTPEASVYYQDQVLFITLPQGVLVVGSVVEQPLRPFESYYYRFPLRSEKTINDKGDRIA